MLPLDLLDQTFADNRPSHGLAPLGDAALPLATHRLRSLAERAGGTLGKDGHELISELLEAAAETEQRLADQARRIRQLESLSVTDELTGLFNRRGFASAVERALAACKRHGEPGLLILVDLDRFKAVNDTYGHLAGDAVLKAVAELLLGTLRKSDIVARLGGDEFAALLPRTKETTGNKLATKVDRLINNLRVPYGRSELPVSASVGWQGYGPRSHADQLIFAADRALYKAKRPGSAPLPDPVSVHG
jgi:diguanylate cyclase (GGDEF)-like protein